MYYTLYVIQHKFSTIRNYVSFLSILCLFIYTNIYTIDRIVFANEWRSTKVCLHDRKILLKKFVCHELYGI